VKNERQKKQTNLYKWKVHNENRNETDDLNERIKAKHQLHMTKIMIPNGEEEEISNTNKQEI